MAKRKRKGSKKKGRQLWTKIRARVPGNVSRAQFWGTLRKAVRSKDYTLPEGWAVSLSWRNKADAEMRSDDFTTAMEESAESSRGWDGAILHYIDRQIERLPERRSVPAIMAADTKRARFMKRSQASRKGWRIRKAAQRKRSAAARKGWRTRRAQK